MGNNKRDGIICVGVLGVMFFGTSVVLLMSPKPPEVITTTTRPPHAEAGPVQPVVSIFELLDEALKTQLRVGALQGVNAGVAAIFGVVAVLNGEFVLKYLIVGATFVTVYLLAMSEVSAIFGPEYPRHLAQIFALEVGVACAYAALRGISGVMLAVGAFLGVILARQVQMLFLFMGLPQFGSNVWVVLGWYTILILVGMRVMFKKKYMTLLGLLSSAVGGLLLSSSIMWFSTFITLKIHPGKPGVVEGAWVDFLLQLTNPEAQDVGLFTQHSKVSIGDGHAYPLDRVLGCGLWLLLFLIGSIFQLRKEAALGVDKQISRTWSSSSFASGRERTIHPLRQPILDKSEEGMA